MSNLPGVSGIFFTYHAFPNKNGKTDKYGDSTIEAWIHYGDIRATDNGTISEDDFIDKYGEDVLFSAAEFACKSLEEQDGVVYADYDIIEWNYITDTEDPIWAEY